MTTRPDADLGRSWWYQDGVFADRCRLCQRLRAEPHGPLCVLGKVIDRLNTWRADQDDDPLQAIVEVMELLDMTDAEAR